MNPYPMLSFKLLSTETDLNEIHAVYCKGGKARQAPLHVVYNVATCPHEGCNQHLQAIDFRLEAYGKAIHDPLVRAWWDDTGFAGRCPHCQGWIHFTIRGKQAISEGEAAALPRLPEDWYAVATIL